MKKGILIVFSGPSGVGKDTVTAELLKIAKDLELSVSVTTRKPRKNEMHGKDYFFTDKPGFIKKIKEGKMLEYACYCGNYYGTPAENIKENLKKGVSVILIIEVKGATQVLKENPGLLSIFLVPPSMEALKERLLKRGSETLDTIEKRIKEAKREMNFSKNYKYIVKNNESKTCAEEILRIIEAHRE